MWNKAITNLQILSDAERRRKYDLYGTKGDQQGNPGRAPQDIFESFFAAQPNPAAHNYSANQNRFGAWGQAPNQYQVSNHWSMTDIQPPPQPTTYAPSQPAYTHPQPSYAQPQPTYPQSQFPPHASAAYGSGSSAPHVYGAGSATQSYGQTQYQPPSYAHHIPKPPSQPQYNHQFPQAPTNQPQAQPQSPPQNVDPEVPQPKNQPVEIGLACTLEELYKGEGMRLKQAY